jgi:hypothetical protein
MSEVPTEAARTEAARDEARRRERQLRIQRQLDEALAASFPASDPVSIVTSHDEEDWGTEAVEPDAPQAPAKPVPRAGG